jgi:Domain of unknown function (DUF4262)
MTEERAWLFAAQPAWPGWCGLAAMVDGSQAGCWGYELLSFGPDGRPTAAEPLGVDNPASAAVAAARAFGVNGAGWRPAYALLGTDPLPWSEIALRMQPGRLERERRACLQDQYDGLFDEVSGRVGEARAAAIVPMVRAVSSLDELCAVIGGDAAELWDAWWRHPDVDPSEKAVLADIDRYGWHGLWLREDDEGPQFTYSIGFYRTLGAAEVIVVGIRPELAHSMLWEAYRRARRGETLMPGRYYDGFLDGHPVTFVNVSDDARGEYFGFAHWYYKGEFPALQLVWPSAADGRWPWDSESLARLQPLLGLVPPAAGPVPLAAGPVPPAS